MYNILAHNFNSAQFKMNLLFVSAVSEAGFRNMLGSMAEPAPALTEHVMRKITPVCMRSILKKKHMVREFKLSLEGEWEGKESSEKKYCLRFEK